MAAPELAGKRLSPMSAARWRWAVVLSCIAVVALLALQVLTHGPMVELDQEASAWFAGHRNAALAQVMHLVTTLHRTTMVLAATAVIAVALALRRQWPAVRALIVVPAGMLLNVALKDSIQRARPRWDDPVVQLASYSFPSGHAVASTVFYGMLCAIVFAHTRSPLARGLALAFAVSMVAMVCFSRVYLGAHYPSDVLAGSAEGLACVLVCVGLLRHG